MKTLFRIAMYLCVLILVLSAGCKKDDGSPSYAEEMKDVEGNPYKTVKIGTQTWMAENLRTTKYRNGEPIANVTQGSAWSSASLKTGAYCWYNNDPAKEYTYGALYNWYAVTDKRNLAPEGWHIPTDEEWSTLVAFLGGEAVAGGKMKEIGTLHWFSPNLGASNEFLFSLLPAGVREGSEMQATGSFWGINDKAYLWSSSQSSPTLMLFRRVSKDGADCFSASGSGQYGMSVRCIKD